MAGLVDEAGDAEADGHCIAAAHFLDERGGGGDDLGGIVDGLGHGLADGVAFEADLAAFDAAGGEGEADDMAALGIDLERHARAAGTGGLGDSFAEDAHGEEDFGDAADVVWGEAGALVELPAAEPSLFPEGPHDLPLAQFEHD